MTPLTPTQELNTQIAEQVMGWTNIHWSDRSELYAATPESAPGRTRVHLFTESLDAVAQAERALIEMGGLDEYIEAHRRNWEECEYVTVTFEEYLIRLPASFRARAIVQALTPLGRHALSDSGGEA